LCAVVNCWKNSGHVYSEGLVDYPIMLLTLHIHKCMDSNIRG